MIILWLLLAVVGVSLVMTGVLRKYALSRSLLDVPNSRSSHAVPTPRGGGVAIVLAFLAVLPILGWMSILTWPVVVALLGAGLLVAMVGFLDDHGHVPARWRLLGHFSAAVWALWWFGGLPQFVIFGTLIDPGWFGNVVATIYLVWLLNLYNFMDGIDGIASVEAVCTCLGGAMLYWLVGRADLAIVPLLLGLATAGFLYWNFPPARIFMGDAGSGFLGISLGLLSIQAAWVSPDLLWSWIILLGVFVVDSTWTLMRRLLRGDKVYEAHRSHAYQYAARKLGKHLPVTLAVAGINLFWLLPISLWVAVGTLDGLVGVVLAYLPLHVLAIRYRAGEKE
ncbi:glycosyltransferase family 4 protein [Metapseudomonas lalkuanensis]|uniref:Glycosyltransferase family 4 protein n=1 Tax=Metapseudomonas lalkuanensis TaxID=2604832 RepID=A0A5J6QKC0_9GAMM|nr:glycosyltransferase family 4 protein [Pseudomonas lalkuanensis]QEY62235.1 glycosyltransferase family 4 protein [Pseudomonas lalkuanensis]